MHQANRIRDRAGAADRGYIHWQKQKHKLYIILYSRMWFRLSFANLKCCPLKILNLRNVSKNINFEFSHNLKLYIIRISFERVLSDIPKNILLKR
jgi:hypothetical protein